MKTIGKLAQSFGLSRSTLLYYSKIGLLRPSCHTAGEYRLYSSSDEERLKRIVAYRDAGISLKNIAKILDSNRSSEINQILESRLNELSEESRSIQYQQQFIATLLGRNELFSQLQNVTKEQWVFLLRSAGFSDADMWQWHIDFERKSPKKHQLFLEMLQMPADEIAEIRTLAQSRTGNTCN